MAVVTDEIERGNAVVIASDSFAIDDFFGFSFQEKCFVFRNDRRATKMACSFLLRYGT